MYNGLWLGLLIRPRHIELQYRAQQVHPVFKPFPDFPKARLQLSKDTARHIRIISGFMEGPTAPCISLKTLAKLNAHMASAVLGGVSRCHEKFLKSSVWKLWEISPKKIRGSNDFGIVDLREKRMELGLERIDIFGKVPFKVCIQEEEIEQAIVENYRSFRSGQQFEYPTKTKLCKELLALLLLLLALPFRLLLLVDPQKKHLNFVPVPLKQRSPLTY
mmetsp:Transcript_37222/g.60267  ORF Transcript_37222/g.60267 Transcript_37222/m.60267 type:complete len:218 (-) Transcript_37222:873-1526(-)